METRNEYSSKTTVRIRKGQGRSLKVGGAWIYDNEIESINGALESGDMVTVEDPDGYPPGTGYTNTRFRLTVRMVSRRKDTVIDSDFLEMWVRNAWDYRKVMTDTSSYHVTFGEADFLPGIVTDKFSDALAVESLVLGIDRLKSVIVDKLRRVMAEDGIAIRGIYKRSDAKARLQEGMERHRGFVGDAFDTKVEILENGVRYMADVEDGQKTGFFLDQKYNRLAVQNLCRRIKPEQVLDCFTHTGSSALNAGLVGSARVLGADVSGLTVNQARENAVLNGLMEQVQFECADVFSPLPRLEQEDHKYDVVILDPPVFTKSRDSIKNVVKGYREINLRGIELAKDGDYLVTCSCSHFMDPELFTKTIREVAGNVHKRLRQVEYRTQAADHPILWVVDGSYYLKLYIFQVCDGKQV